MDVDNEKDEEEAAVAGTEIKKSTQEKSGRISLQLNRKSFKCLQLNRAINIKFMGHRRLFVGASWQRSVYT